MLTFFRKKYLGMYRYGFNGMEADDGVKGKGNSYTTSFRQYDVRIARWLSLAPVTHAQFSPYSAFDNNPIFWADPSGADSERPNDTEPPVKGKDYDEVTVTAKRPTSPKQNKIDALYYRGKFGSEKYDSWRSSQEAYKLSRELMNNDNYQYGTTDHASNYDRNNWCKHDLTCGEEARKGGWAE